MFRLYKAYQTVALFRLMPLLSGRRSLSVCHFNNSVESTLPLISLIIPKRDFPESEQAFLLAGYSRHMGTIICAIEALGTVQLENKPSRRELSIAFSINSINATD